MSQVTENALKGYSYQDYIYILFMTIMDTGDDIVSIDAEVGKDNKKHDFDDIKIYTKNKEYLVQAKDYKKFDSEKFKVDSEFIEVNGVKSKLSKDRINIFVLYNCPLETDCTIWGLDALKKDNLYIIPLPTKKIEAYIEGRYDHNVERELQVIYFAKARLASAEFYCEKKELPLMKVYRQKMDNETILIRKTIFDLQEGILYIVGKPGVGKSHYVHELATALDNTVIYHFWIGAQDEFINERLQYQNFINNLGYSIYHDCRKFTEEELIEEIIRKGKILIIDGIDHVENYNERQLEKYFEFFSKLEKTKTIILTRPLKHSIGNNIYHLENWNFQENSCYLEQCYHIYENQIQRKIYDITDGYPLITFFVTQHYILYGEVEATEKISDLNEYYEKLLEQAGIRDAMMIFCTTNSFLTPEDIKIIASNPILSNIIFDSIKRYPYLFDLKYNRIMLFHDSFNTFLRMFVKDDGIQVYVDNIENSLLSGTIRFMSRFMSLAISDNVKEQLLVEYADLDKFIQLIECTWDIESVVEFYSQLLQYLAMKQANILDVYQYYAFVLIQECCSRVQVNYDMGLLYQKIRYAHNFKKEYLGEIFSNHVLLKICGWIFDFKDGIFEIRENISEDFIDVFKHQNEKFFLQAIEEDEDYFEKYINKIDYVEFISTHLASSDENDHKYQYCAQLIVNLYLNNEEFDGITGELKKYLDGKVVDEEKGCIKTFIDLYDIRYATVKGILIYCKHILFSIGKLEMDNPYRKETLKTLLLNKQEMCSEKTSCAQNYIRLAIYENHEISIAEANYCYIMLQEEKDYSVLWVPEATLFYERKYYQSPEVSLRQLTNIMKLSSRGLNGLIDTYINLYSTQEITYMIQTGLLEKNYPINILNWNPELIDCVPEKFIIQQVIEMMRSRIYINFFEEQDMINLLQSKYGNMVKQLLKREGFRVINLSQNSSAEQKKKTYRERGYIDIDDKEQIIEDRISCLELASYKSGHNESFPELTLFEIYSKDEIKKNYLTIIHISLTTKSRTIERYGNMYSYVAHIPKLADMAEYNIEWQKMYKIFIKYLLVTGIILE